MTTVPAAALQLYPQVEFPQDPGLREFPSLFDPDWVWQAYEEQCGRREVSPERIRIREFSHSRGRTAAVSYDAEWRSDDYIPSQTFTIRIERDKPVDLFQYPEDRSLPGLVEAAQPDSALRLVNRHVLAIPARRLRVELVRYRPASRAVLRHVLGKARFYARVMQPAAVGQLLAARNLVGRSGFLVPRLAGHWQDGAVLWMSEIPGRNLQGRIRRGKGPDPDAIFERLETLWELPQGPDSPRPFNLAAAYSRAKRSLRHKIRDDKDGLRNLGDAVRVLDPFVESWQPSGTAHNDFYDDQMLALPDGRISLVDFEEAGPGDPLLDVGNFLAHLRSASRFGPKGDAQASSEYYEAFRHGAIDRFRWSEGDLALREAVCLFRICTNAIRHPRTDWQGQLHAGLLSVNESLG